MPSKLTSSATFSVMTVVDGKPAPYYHDQWYGWSAGSSTGSATTPPPDVTWTRYVPTKPTGRDFLWLKDTLYVWNEDQNEYQQQGSTTYTRINGEDGKGIQIKGTVVAVEQTALPSSGVNNGDMGLLKGSAYVYTYNNDTWIRSATASSVGDGYILQTDGYIWVWNGQAWQRGGQVKGEDGESSYIHIAWAHDIDPTVGYPTAGMGFTTTKNPEDKYEYIGIATNNDPNDDPDQPQDYIWDEVEGVGGTTFTVQSSISSMVVPSNSSTVNPGAITFYAYSKVGSDEQEALSCYFGVFRKKGSTYTNILRSSSPATSVTYPSTLYNANECDSVVCCIYGTYAAALYHYGYLAEVEVPIRKNGDDAIILDLDNENDSMVYKTDLTTLVGSKPTCSWHLYRGGQEITDLVSKNDTNCRITPSDPNHCTASWTATTGTNAYRTVQVDSLTTDTVSIDITITFNGTVYTATMTLKRLIGIDKYELVVSPNGIAANTTDDSKSTTKTVNVKVYKTDANDGQRHMQFPVSDANSPCYLYLVPINANGTEAAWSLIQRGTGSNYYNSTDGYTFTADTSAFSAYRFYILKSAHGANDVVLDTETIPISKVADGNGIQSVAMAYAVSLYGSSANDSTPPQSIQGSWSVNPPYSSLTNSYRYLWQRETTTYTQGDVVVKYYLMASKGADASSIIQLDLSNEMDGIALDDNGRAVAQTTIESDFRLYNGSEAQTIAANEVSVTGLTASGVSYNISNTGTNTPHIAITINANATLPNDRLVATITVTKGGVGYSGNLTIMGMRGGYVYQLNPSSTSISRKANTNTPSEISCDVIKSGGRTSITNPSGVTIMYSIDGATEQTYTQAVSTALVTSKLTFICYVGGTIVGGTIVGGTIVDRETIPVVESATPTPYHEIRYAYSSESTTANNTTPPSDVSEWYNTIPTSVSSKPYLWMKDTYWVWNATAEQYRSNGITYARLTGESGVGIHPKGSVVAVRYQQSDFYSMPGTTGDLGIYVYGARLMYYNGSYWQDNGPTASTGDCYFDEEFGHLWAYNDGQWYDMGQIAGENGTSAFVHFAWANTLGPTSPSEASYPDWTGLGTGFTTAKEAGQRFKYMGVLSNDDGGSDPDITHAGEYSWTEVEGAPSVHYELVLDGETWAHVDSSNNLSARINGHAYMMAGTTRTPLSQGYKIRVGYSQTSTGTSTVYPQSDGSFSSVRNDVDWDSVNNSASMYVRLLNASNDILAATIVEVAVTGTSGQKGDIGRNIYFAGDWSNTETYVATSISAPYVRVVKDDWVHDGDHNVRFYLLTGDNGTSTNYSTDENPKYPWESGSPWVEMSTDFKYMITEAVFADFAKLGSGVFNKDWLFSQYGQHAELQEDSYTLFEPDFANTDVLTMVNENGSELAITATSENPFIIRETNLAQAIQHSLAMVGRVVGNDNQLHLRIVNRDNADDVLANLTLGTTVDESQTATVTSLVGGAYQIEAWVKSGTGYIKSLTMQASTPFIPNVAIDWYTGYAHFGNARVRFNHDGSGHVANGKISWDASGNASFDGNVVARSGNIGNFTLDNGYLRIGTNANWGDTSASGNYTMLSDGKVRAQTQENDVFSQVAIGKNAYTVGDSRAMVVRRLGLTQSDYIPAMEIYTGTNPTSNHQIALRTNGLNVANNGIAAFGNFLVLIANETNLDLSKGCEQVIVNNSTSTRVLYLPEVEDINTLLMGGSSSSPFALHIRLIAYYSAGHGNINIKFQSNGVGFIHYNGEQWATATGGVTISRGQTLDIMLIYYAGNYYAQRITAQT